MKTSDVVEALIEANIPRLFLQVLEKTTLSLQDAYYALQWSIEEGHLQVLSHLLRDKRLDLLQIFPEDVHNSQTTPLKAAVKAGRSDILQTLLLSSPTLDPSVIDNWAIRWAAENGNSALVELLLDDYRVNPADLESYALRMACKNNHFVIVDLLLKDGRSNAAADKNYAICTAAKSGYRSIMGLLVEARVDPNEHDFKYHHLTADQQFYLLKELQDIKDGVRPTPKVVKTFDCIQSGGHPVEVFEIDRILAKRQTRCPHTFEYLVSWKGFPNEEDQSWLAYKGAHDMEWAEDAHLVQDFERTQYTLLPVSIQTPSRKKTPKKKGARIVKKKCVTPLSVTLCSKSSSSKVGDGARRLLFKNY